MGTRPKIAKLRLRTAAFAILGAVASAASTAATDSELTASAVVAADGTAPWSSTDDSRSNGKVRQGDTVAYTAQARATHGSLHDVSLTLTASPAWAARNLRVEGCSSVTTGDVGTTCKLGDLAAGKRPAKSVTVTVDVPDDAATGSPLKLAVTAHSAETDDVAAKAAGTRVVRPGQPTSSPSPSSSSSTPSQSSSSPSHPSSSPTHPSSGPSASQAPSTPSGSNPPHQPTSSDGHGSEGDGDASNGGSSKGTHDRLPAGMSPGNAAGSSASVSGTSTVPLPQVANPPSSSASPHELALRGASGIVHPISDELPLVAFGLVVVALCGYHLLRRRRHRAVRER